MKKQENLKAPKKKFTASTKGMSLDQEISQAHNYLKSLFGSFLVVLSVAVLFTDRVTTFGLTDSNGYNNVETFIWMISQSLSPILLCIAAMLKPYKIFYFLPVYIYFIQMYWVFDYDMKVDDPLLHFYAVGFCLGAFLFFSFVLMIIRFIAKRNNVHLINMKRSIRHISIFISEKYINKLPEKDRKNYTIDTVEYIDSLD